MLLGGALMVALFFASLSGGSNADATEGEALEVWGVSGGVVEAPKTWKFTQSVSASTDLGSATAADPDLDDSAWGEVELRWEDFPGPGVANHFRKDFTLADIGVELFQIVGIEVTLQYDDTAVMYLNGVEVYRSIRGNVDPDYSLYAIGDDIPFDLHVPFGGFENFYVKIPDDGSTTCQNSPDCVNSPYGGPEVPAIPVSLLNPTGVNTWAVTTWNNSNGGSGDASLDHTFELLIDVEAVSPSPMVINEVMASNDTAYAVQLDDDGDVDHPDWFELRNTSPTPVDLEGWTIADSSAIWVFPSVVVPAHGYLVVIANDGDRIDTSPLQTNFKLSATGDTLKLTRPDGFVADEYSVIPDQFADSAYGRPEDSGAPTYLRLATPGSANSTGGRGYAPILRPFADRLYNQGEPVTNQVDAFDPDGGALSYEMSPRPPGLSIDDDGEITGVATEAGTFSTTITVTDADGESAGQQVRWIVVPEVAGPPPIVLNEYNAVPATGELSTGGQVGNGGDWFEFVVIEDDLDLRGYTIELYDRKGPDDDLRLAAIVAFGDDPRIAQIAAGTLITISEDLVDDLDIDFDTDWHINFQIDNDGNGAFFAPSAPGSVFNSTRTGQAVLVRNADGRVVSPLSGETDAWDEAGGGVSESEVMNLCRDLTADMVLDPIADYRDNGFVSSFGGLNTCVFPDPADARTMITVVQDASTLRSSNLGEDD